jgi:hypothetical protein
MQAAAKKIAAQSNRPKSSNGKLATQPLHLHIADD